MNKKKTHSFEFKLSCVKQMDEQYRSAKSLSKNWELPIHYLIPGIGYLSIKGLQDFFPEKGKGSLVRLLSCRSFGQSVKKDYL